MSSRFFSIRKTKVLFKFITAFFIFLALISADALTNVPLAWASNSWNSPDMIIDTFTPCGLGSAVDAARGDSPYIDITSLAVSGAAMNDFDFAFIRDNLSSIETIDISDVPITDLPPFAFINYQHIPLAGKFDNLKNVALPSELTSIGEMAFSHCPNLILTNLPLGLTSIGAYAFNNCQSLVLTSLPPELTSIGKYAFSNCPNLALTSLPPELTSIGAYAFNNCPSLALTSLPSGLTSIGFYTFGHCANLALTSLPSGLTSIGAYAFNNCPNLALTSLPSGLTTIDEYAFGNCTSIESLDMSPCSALVSIASKAFAGCASLAIVIMPQTCPTVKSDAFLDTASELVFRAPDTPAYRSWNPPVGKKVYLANGTDI
jgi:hypothetical protein